MMMTDTTVYTEVFIPPRLFVRNVPAIDEIVTYSSIIRRLHDNRLLALHRKEYTISEEMERAILILTERFRIYLTQIDEGVVNDP